MRSTAVRPDAPHLTLLQGEGIPDPQKYLSPVRAGSKTRPEWQLGLPSGLVDLPDPEAPATHIEAAIDLLRRAAQSSTVSERGDATLVAIEHSARAFGELFDRETAKKLLRDIADSL